MASLLHRGLLVLPPGLPAGDLLEKELRAYTIKQRASGHVYTEAAKESDHDDLVTALALAVWLPNWIGTPRYMGEDGELHETAVERRQSHNPEEPGPTAVKERLLCSASDGTEAIIGCRERGLRHGQASSSMRRLPFLRLPVPRAVRYAAH